MDDSFNFQWWQYILVFLIINFWEYMIEQIEYLHRWVLSLSLTEVYFLPFTSIIVKSSKPAAKWFSLEEHTWHRDPSKIWSWDWFVLMPRAATSCPLCRGRQHCKKLTFRSNRVKKLSNGSNECIQSGNQSHVWYLNGSQPGIMINQ